MSASVILDIILGVLALLTILKYTLRGFVGSILDVAKVILAAILAYLIRIPVAKLFEIWFMNDSMVDWVRNSLTATVEGNDTFIDFISLYENVPWLYNSVLSHFGLGDVSALETLSDTASYAQIEELSIEIGLAISNMLSTILAILVLFIIILIVLSIIVRLIDDLLIVSSVSKLNRLLGFALGVAVAFAMIWIISFVLEFLVDVTSGFGGNLTREDLDKSMLIGLVNTIL